MICMYKTRIITKWACPNEGFIGEVRWFEYLKLTDIFLRLMI